jgi:voltage-gated potassium channel
MRVKEWDPFSDSKIGKIKKYYRSFKIKLYNILENENSPYKQIYDVFALFVVITSSIGVVIEYVPGLKPKLPPDLNSFIDSYEYVALWFFVVEYITRWWVISNFFDDFKKAVDTLEEKNNLKLYLKAFFKALKVKLKWMFSLYALIDLIAILPIIRPLRAFRIIRLLRLLKIIRYGGALRSLFVALKEQSFLFAFIFTSIFAWIIIFSIIVYIFEYNAGNTEQFKSMWHAIYWGIVTISTVGFGDIAPISNEARIATSIMIGGGIILVASLTGTFSAALVSRLITLKQGGLKMPDLENHIVICGWNETSEEVLEQIMAHEIDKEKGVVLITSFDKEQLDIELSDFILYKKGEFIHESVLLDIGIEKASDVLIVGEREEGLTERNVDARTALAAMLIRTLNPDANLYVEVLLDEDASIFKERLRIREVLIHGQLMGRLMFNSLLNPGLTNLVNTFIGEEYGVKKVKVSKLGKFMNFGELLLFARKKNYLPIAIERRKKVIMNPKDTFILEKDDFVFLLPSGG